MESTPSRKNILVVEDDLAIRDTLVEILEMEGYSVAVAGHGKEALEYLEKGVIPNLIFLDLMMPVMDGFSFRREQLKNQVWAKIPTIVMSADRQAQEKVAQLEGLTFLRKPPDLNDLIEAAARYSGV